LPGGAGYGAPHKRDPERVAEDVRQGRVSEEMAVDAYGIEIGDDGKPIETSTRTGVSE